MAVSRISPLASSSVPASTGPPTFSPLSPPPKHRSNMMRFLTRKYLIAGAPTVSSVGSLVLGLTIPRTPAPAQLNSFDPRNHTQHRIYPRLTPHPPPHPKHTTHTPKSPT